MIEITVLHVQQVQKKRAFHRQAVIVKAKCFRQTGYSDSVASLTYNVLFLFLPFFVSFL
jgi:hypothetical protein